MIVVNEPVEKAWLRVSLALDRSNFTVDDRNRDQGIFVVRYVDPVRDNEKQGFFGKMFGRKSSSIASQPYRVSLRNNSNGGTQVSIVDSSGRVDDSAAARHLLNILQAQLS